MLHDLLLVWMKIMQLISKAVRLQTVIQKWIDLPKKLLIPLLYPKKIKAKSTLITTGDKKIHIEGLISQDTFLNKLKLSRQLQDHFKIGIKKSVRLRALRASKMSITICQILLMFHELLTETSIPSRQRALIWLFRKSYF